MVERAARLCEADEAAVRTFDGELLHLAAVHGSQSEVVTRLRQLGPTRASGLYEPFARGERIATYTDARETDVYRDDPVVRQRLELRGIRTWLAAALQKDGALLGVINVHRHAVRPFSDKQIGLLQNFAAQAVIAMENARLLTEQREALEHQTATAEVLQVINASPGNLTPVFEMILEKAHSLVGAVIGALVLYEGLQFRGVATHGFSALHEALVRQPHGPTAGQLELVAGARFKHYHDMMAAEDDPITRSHVENNRTRTGLWVPLRKDGQLLGFISCYRREVRPFVEKEIALLEGFAAQAVIAMENARLLNEVRQRQEELRITFENMGDGVAMFDETPRLVAWNRKFQDLLDVPDGVLAERLTYEDYIRYLADARRVWARCRPGRAASPLPRAYGRPLRVRAYQTQRACPRGPAQPGPRRRLRADLRRHHRTQAERRRTSRCPRYRRGSQPHHRGCLP